MLDRFEKAVVIAAVNMKLEHDKKEAKKLKANAEESGRNYLQSAL